MSAKTVMIRVVIVSAIKTYVQERVANYVWDNEDGDD